MVALGKKNFCEKLKKKKITFDKKKILKEEKKYSKEIIMKKEEFLDSVEKNIFLTSLFNSLINMANCLINLRNYEEAENCLLEALKISENYLLYFLLAQNIYCNLNSKISHLEKSYDFILKAIDLKKKDVFFKNSYNVLVAFNLHNLDFIFEEQKKKIWEMIEIKKREQRGLINFVFRESLKSLKKVNITSFFFKENLKSENHWDKINLENEIYLEKIKDNIIKKIKISKNAQNEKEYKINLEKFSEIEKLLMKLKFLKKLKFDIELIEDDNLEIEYEKLLLNEKKYFLIELIFFKIKSNFIKRLKSKFKIEHEVYKEIFKDKKFLEKKNKNFDNTVWLVFTLITFFLILSSIKFLKRI